MQAAYPAASSADVVIIGGGIIGCACAYFLAKAGARVQVLERGPLGSGASKAGMSHVVTWEEPDAHLILARASQQLYEALCGELAEDIEYRRTGSIAVVENPDGLPAMQAMVDRLRQKGVACEFLAAGDLRKLEPGLAPDLAGGAYFPGDGQVNPLYTTQALARAARETGAQMVTHSEVTGIEVSGGKVAAVMTAVERIAVGQVLIAAGAWSSAVARLAGVELPIQPRKGTLVVTAPVPDNLLRCKIILSAGYMESVHGSGDAEMGRRGDTEMGGSGRSKPPSEQGSGHLRVTAAVAANIQQVKNGNLLLGSSRQFAGFDLSVDPAVVQQVVARCLRFLPALSGVLAIRMWSGLRPYTPDLLPVIGPVRQVEGLYIAAGHEGIGITEAPITGKLISQMIMGEQVEEPLAGIMDNLSPGRFNADYSD